MSWIERIKNDLIITTGDGREYRPLYMITKKKTDYNIAQFEFPEVVGSKVDRGTPKGSTYTFDMTFQGEDNLDQMRAFEKSNLDRRPWNVVHPIYGNIVVQPTSLEYDPSGLNTTKISGSMVETITGENPKIGFDPVDKTGFDVDVTNELTVETFGNNVTPDVSDKAQMSSDVNAVYDQGAESVKSGEESNEYFNLYQEAEAAILGATEDATAAAQAIVNMMMYPAQFTDTVKARLNLFKFQFLKLSETLDQLNDYSSKSIYEMNAGTLVAGMVSTSVSQLDSDYANANEVVEAIDILLDVQNQFISNLDQLQSDNGGQVGNYVPNFNALSALNSVVSYAVSQLFNIALDSKQERVLILEGDSSPIVLAHRFYGLDVDDSTIDTFMAQNNIGLKSLLIVEKGTRIVYYV